MILNARHGLFERGDPVINSGKRLLPLVHGFGYRGHCLGDLFDLRSLGNAVAERRRLQSIHFPLLDTLEALLHGRGCSGAELLSGIEEVHCRDLLRLPREIARHVLPYVFVPNWSGIAKGTPINDLLPFGTVRRDHPSLLTMPGFRHVCLEPLHALAARRKRVYVLRAGDAL